MLGGDSLDTVFDLLFTLSPAWQRIRFDLDNFPSLQEAISQANFFSDPDESSRKENTSYLLTECKRILSHPYYVGILEKYDLTERDAVPILIVALGKSRFKIDPLGKILKGLQRKDTKCFFGVRHFMLYLFHSLMMLPKVNANDNKLYLPSSPNHKIDYLTRDTMYSSDFMVAYRDVTYAELVAKGIHSPIIYEVTGNCICCDIGDFIASKMSTIIILPSTVIKKREALNSSEGTPHVPITIDRNEFIYKNAYDKFLAQIDQSPIDPQNNHIKKLLWKVTEGILDIPTIRRPLTCECIEKLVEKIHIVNTEDTILQLYKRFLEAFDSYKRGMGYSRIRDLGRIDSELHRLTQFFLSLIKAVHSKGNFANKIVFTVKPKSRDIQPHILMDRINDQIFALYGYADPGIEKSYVIKRGICYVTTNYPVSLIDKINSKPIIPGCFVRAERYNPAVAVLPFNDESLRYGDLSDNEACNKLEKVLKEKNLYPTSILIKQSATLGTKLFVLSFVSSSFIQTLKGFYRSAYACPVVKSTGKVNNVCLFRVFELCGKDVINVIQNEDNSYTITLLNEDSHA